ncbi:Protein of unknown function [Bacillus mobilis]|nr:Protein of unknown function [Bacillus mobilis]
MSKGINLFGRLVEVGIIPFITGIMVGFIIWG